MLTLNIIYVFRYSVVLIWILFNIFMPPIKAVKYVIRFTFIFTNTTRRSLEYVFIFFMLQRGYSMRMITRYNVMHL